MNPSIVRLLDHIQARGPTRVTMTTKGRLPAYVTQCADLGLIERLNKMNPGLPVYEITKAGRQALAKAKK